MFAEQVPQSAFKDKSESAIDVVDQGLKPITSYANDVSTPILTYER